MYEQFERMVFFALAAMFLLFGGIFAFWHDNLASVTSIMTGISVLFYYAAIQRRHHVIIRFFFCCGWAAFHAIAMISALSKTPNIRATIWFTLLGLLMPIAGLIFGHRQSKNMANSILPLKQNQKLDE